MSLSDKFNEAAERVKSIKEASNEDKLNLYGLFKFISKDGLGPDTSRPSMWNMADQAKVIIIIF